MATAAPAAEAPASVAVASRSDALSGHVEVVVVGAGISGLCCALHLAAAGCGVVVLDRADPWGDASGANAGTLSVQVKRPEVLHVTREAVRLWGSFRAEFGIDVGFGQPGGVRVATTMAELALLRQSVRVQQGLGIDVELLAGDEVHDRFPWLGPGVLAAASCGLDAFSSPLLAGPALIRACREAGAQVLGHAGVEAIEERTDGFLMTTAAGALSCRRLVIAAGAWSGEITAMLGAVLPVLVDVNMLSVTEPAPPLLDRVVTHAGGILSLKQYPNGTCVIGGGWQGRGGLADGRRDLDHENLLHNLRVAAAVVPALAELRVVRSWSGFEAVAPDALPVLGPLPGQNDAYVLACARGGYSQGPALGKLLAELMLEGTTSLPVDGFGPGRFWA